MKIVFRVDASLEIGTGHVMRCLTLADEFKERGSQCYFICRPHKGNLLELIEQRGHRALTLPELVPDEKPILSDTDHAHWLGTDWATDASQTQELLRIELGSESADWLVIDHYALDVQWEQALRPKAKSIMVIDDLADRTHDCELLLDQNLGRKHEDYADLLVGETIKLIGPKYALLRPEFALLRFQSLARRISKPQLRQLLITMGGVDKENATSQILNALKACQLPADLHIVVVMGPYAPWLEQVQALSTELPWHTEVLVGVNNMPQLMTDSDLAIGAAGSTSWERCCLGLPTIQVALAHNQVPIANVLAEAGAAWMLPVDAIAEALPKMLTDISASDKLQTLTKICSTITEGKGASLVGEFMIKQNENHAIMQ
jgi:UDP-2,4-diacetamido-2,4,6-trideoxy-beta-L-altropyranose hydrolase